MKRTTLFPVIATAALLAISPIGTAQEGGGWRRVGDESARQQPSDENQEPRAESREVRDAAPPPEQLLLPAGTWIKARVDEPLSSNQNLAGDIFTATLTAPLVVDGYVVARRGQTIEGRVTEARKAGRSKGTSALGIEITQISLVDGRQMPVRTQLMEYSGGTSVGRDVAGAATVTGTGAAIGAAAGGGLGAGIGALAGAAASAVGVLTTRGRATEIYPEAEIRFRTMEPVTISTERSGQVFLPVRQEDYSPTLQRRVTVQRNQPMPWYGPGYWGPAWGPYWGSPYWGRSFWGPSIFFYSGPRYYRGRGHFRRR